MVILLLSCQMATAQKIDYLTVRRDIIDFSCVNITPEYIKSTEEKLAKVNPDSIAANKDIYFFDKSNLYYLKYGTGGNKLPDLLQSKAFVIEAIKINPNIFNYYWALSMNYSHLKNCDSVKVNLNKYLELFPKEEGLAVDSVQVNRLKAKCP